MLSPESKVWIYQSNRRFTEAESEQIQQELQQFVMEWAAHGQHLQAVAQLHYQQFIVFMVDEKAAYAASGCSIDSSVHFLKDVEKRYGVNLFNRLKVAYRDGEEVKTVSQSTFRKLLAEGVVQASTVVFNNLVATKAAFDTQWEVPISESWHKQLL